MSDLIERQKAIDELISEPPEMNYGFYYAEKIKALPPAQPEPCDDVVSREAAIDVAENAFVRGLLASPDIRRLPSAQPQIIRCKDCNYACIDPERESDEIYCSENDFWKDDDFYCGYAERRTDG